MSILQAMFVAFLSLLTLSDGKGEIWLTLLRYENTHGKNARNTPCDTDSKCDLYFTFSMTGPGETQGSRWEKITTGVYHDRNEVIFASTLNGGYANPRGGYFKTWSNTIKYVLIVWDHDSSTERQHVDMFAGEINLAADGLERTFTHHGLFHGRHTQYIFKANASCLVHYYGSTCRKYCYPHNNDNDGHYTCDNLGNKVCRPGWRNTTNQCKTRDYCHTNPCQNGGRCENHANSYRCECPTVYTGTNCERHRTPCETENRCVNGGKCVNVGSTAECRCPPEWKEPTCAEDRNECQEGTPCQNNGTCINERGGFRCNCTFGFAGANCSTIINECQASSNRSVLLCKNGGTCVNTRGSLSCLCPPEFEGPKCETDKDECRNPQQCLNGGNCTNTFGGFKCKCPPQYQGLHCQTDVNECVGPNPCKNNGTCSNTEGGFKCICPIGWHGSICEKDDNECTTGALTCLDGGTCVNTDGSAYCRCPATRTGSRCEEDFDECTGMNPCKNGGVCENLKSSTLGYLCNCDGTGFEGRNCTDDVDECKDEDVKQLCGPGGSCKNMKGTYICICRNSTHGFSRENQRCPEEEKEHNLLWIVIGVIVVLLPFCAVGVVVWRRRTDPVAPYEPRRHGEFINNSTATSLGIENQSHDHQ